MTDPVHVSGKETGGSSKPSLPYGWIVRQSTTYPDRVYFFNTVTGASSWEPPVLVDPSKQEAGRQQFQGQVERASFPQDHTQPHQGQAQGHEHLQSSSDGACGLGLQGQTDTAEFHQGHHGNNPAGFAQNAHHGEQSDRHVPEHGIPEPHFSGGGYPGAYGGPPLRGRGQPFLGRGQPMPGRGQPWPARGRPFTGRGQPYDGRGRPFPGKDQPVFSRGKPFPLRGQPMAGRGQPFSARGHLPSGEGQVHGRGQPLPGIGQEVQGSGQSLPGSFEHELDSGLEEYDQNRVAEDKSPALQETGEEARGRFCGLGVSQPLSASGLQVSGRGHPVQGRGKRRRWHKPYKVKRGGNSEKEPDKSHAYHDSHTPQEREINAASVQNEETVCSVMHEPKFDGSVPNSSVGDLEKDVNFRTSYSQVNQELVRPPEFLVDAEDENFYQLDLESPAPVDFERQGHSFSASRSPQSSFSPESRDCTASPVQDVRLVTAQHQSTDTCWEELDTETIGAERGRSRACPSDAGLPYPLYIKPKLCKNSVWTTREPDSRSRALRIKSRLGTRGCSQSYNPKQAHVRPEDARNEALRRFQDSPVPQSPPYAPQVGQVQEEPSGVVDRNAKGKKLKAISPVRKAKKRMSDVSDQSKAKRARRFSAEEKILKSPLKISGKQSKDSKTKSLSPKKLINDPLASKRKVSRFRLSEEVVPAVQIDSTRSPLSEKNTKPHTVQKKVRLKKGLSDSASDHPPLGLDPVYAKPMERGHLKDPDKLASIQSWVNEIEDTPVTCPSSSPDTTRSSLSTGSTLSDNDKFKIPLEALPGQTYRSDSPSGVLTHKEFSDSGYSTSTCPPVTGVSLESTQDVQEAEDMEVDEADLQVVRSSIQANPKQYFGQLTEAFSSADASIHVLSPETPTREHQVSPLFIVLDTNVLMRHLDFLEELRDRSLEGFGRPTLVVPWVVLQELDALKNKQQTFPQLTWKTQNQARAPVQFLYKCFDSKHPRVKGQSSEEASRVNQDMEVTCNDDKVLLCCLQWKEKNPGSIVVLLTDDVNLSTKAIVSNIKVFTRKTILEGLQGVQVSSGLTDFPQNFNQTVTQPENSQVPSSSPQIPPAEKIPQRKIAPVVKESANRNRETELRLADEIICEMKVVLKDIMSHVLEAEMREAFDDLWLSVVLRKPPWSLRDVLECYEKHWIAVFGQEFDRKLESFVSSLLNHFKLSKGYGANIRQACCLLDSALGIVDTISVKKKYSSLTTEPRATLSKLKDLGKQVLEGCKKIEDVPDLQVYLGKVPLPSQVQHLSPSLEGSMVSLDTEDLSSSTSTLTLYQDEVEANLVKGKFQKSWEAIANYCKEVQDMMQKGAFDEVHISVYDHLPVLKDLRKSFISALKVKRRLIPQMNAPFAALCSSLDKIVPPDPANNNDEQSLVDADKLARFFSKKDNRRLLTVGLKQLDDMMRSLFVCVKQA